MQQILNVYQAIPTEVWVALFGGSAASLFAQLIKKYFGLNSEKVIKTLVASTAFVAAALQYLLSTHAISPAILGAHTAAFYSVAELFYAFVYKSATPFLNDVSKYQARKGTSTATVTVPATGTGTTSIAAPVEPGTPAPVDF